MRSTVNCNIWRLFAANGISIPFAQREVRIVPQSPEVTSFGAGDFLRGVPQGDFLRGVGGVPDAQAQAEKLTGLSNGEAGRSL